MDVGIFMEWFVVAMIGVQVLAILWMIVDLSGVGDKLADLWEWMVDSWPKWWAKLKRVADRKTRKRYLMEKRRKAQLDEGLKRMRLIEKEGRDELLRKHTRNIEELRDFDRQMKSIEATAYVTGAGPVAKTQDRLIEDWLNEINKKDRKIKRSIEAQAHYAAEFQRDLDEIHQQMLAARARRAENIEKLRPKKRGKLSESVSADHYAVHYAGFDNCKWGGGVTVVSGHPKQVTCPRCYQRLSLIGRR